MNMDSSAVCHYSTFVGIIGFLAIVQATPVFYAKEGIQQPNKVAGPGLWHSIGENLKTPGEAMPITVHLPHETNPTLLLKDSVKTMAKGNQHEVSSSISFNY